jgi:phage shock protein A
MDQERTMQFILDNLAAVTASQQQAEVRAARAERRIEKTETQIRGITKLVKIGMKLIVEIQKNHRELHAEIKELAAQQKRTDQKFDRWLDSLKNGSNGHSGHKKR